MRLQCRNYKAHILLPLIQRVKAWSVLPHTDILPCIWGRISASLLLLLKLCSVACSYAWLSSSKEDGEPEPAAGTRTDGLPERIPILTQHLSNTESGCTNGDSRSTFSFLLCCMPGSSRWKEEQEPKQQLWIAAGQRQGAQGTWCSPP